MKTTDPKLDAHFSCLIYPFVHGMRGDVKRARRTELGGMWTSWTSRLSDEELVEVIDHSSFFLPYVRDALYPSIAVWKDEPPGDGYAAWKTLIREHEGDTGNVARAFSEGAAAHLTLSRDWMKAMSSISWTDAQATGPSTGRIHWVDAFLFATGVGLLVLKVTMEGLGPTLGNLIGMNGALRIVQPPYLGGPLPVLSVPDGAAAPTVHMAQILCYLLQGMEGGGDAPEPSLSAFLQRNAAKRDVYVHGDMGQSYGERCHVLSWARTRFPEDGVTQGVFDTGLDRLLWEFVTCTPLDGSVNDATRVPRAEYARRLVASQQISEWACWSGLAFQEAVVFLATDDSSFNVRALPNNVEYDYLPLYLITLHHKYRLLLYATDLMRRSARLREDLTAARQLMDRFVHFRNQFWYHDVTRRPPGNAIYRKMQEGAGVPHLYASVSAGVKEIQYGGPHCQDSRIAVNKRVSARLPGSAGERR